MTSPATTRRDAMVLLVDRRGWVLLMERDEHAPLAPDQWGMVGGAVEPGETPERAAYRELREETGIDWPLGRLQLWRVADYQFPGVSWLSRYFVWRARCDLRDEDIVVGEGRQIVFVEPADALALDLAASARHFLPEFLATSASSSVSSPS